ncbi:hypothetical protein EC973_009494 [Apophysomyces ossiformis]|uniref:BZIP domain-containing protein n=1 Tax=Apophysomyces ossiformis TaxID=679940 RepID=A0A8H7BLJ6_9FUNG|nr:hypothetical protein EC973_009494 [Apophysomyces ossiformis]
MSNNMTSPKLNDQCDSLASLLSFPLDFAVNPLVTVSPSTATMYPASDQIATESNDLSSCTSSSSESVSSKKLTQRKARLSLENKDQKAKERILRNRAAAQESRDRKRRYVADLEATNEKLTKENERITKRAKMLETENQHLESQLEMFRRQQSSNYTRWLLRFSTDRDEENFNTGERSNGTCALTTQPLKNPPPNGSHVRESGMDRPGTEEIPFPAAEAVKCEESIAALTSSLLPSPLLSPQCSSEEEEEMSSPAQFHVANEFLLDDLFDWDGQQSVFSDNMFSL